MSRTLTYGCCGAPVDDYHKTFCPDYGTFLVEFKIKAARGTPLTNLLKDLERQAILYALEFTRGHRAQAAKMLGISRKCLHDKMARHEIRFHRYRSLDAADGR